MLKFASKERLPLFRLTLSLTQWTMVRAEIKSQLGCVKQIPIDGMLVGSFNLCRIVANEHRRSRISCWQIAKKVAAATYVGVWFAINNKTSGRRGSSSSIVSSFNRKIERQLTLERQHRDRKHTQ